MPREFPVTHGPSEVIGGGLRHLERHPPRATRLPRPVLPQPLHSVSRPKVPECQRTASGPCPPRRGRAHATARASPEPPGVGSTSFLPSPSLASGRFSE